MPFPDCSRITGNSEVKTVGQRGPTIVRPGETESVTDLAVCKKTLCRILAASAERARVAAFGNYSATSRLFQGDAGADEEGAATGGWAVRANCCRFEPRTEKVRPKQRAATEPHRAQLHPEHLNLGAGSCGNHLGI